MNNGIKFGLPIAIVALVGGYLLFGGKEEPQPQPVEAVKVEPPKPPPVQVPEPEPEVVEAPSEPRPQEEPLLPTPPRLEGSDDEALAIAESLSPTLVQWLVPDEQVRKWVLAVDLLAEGKLPLRHKPIEYPMPKFLVETLSDDEFKAKGSNDDRVTALIGAVTTIPPKTLARYYQAWLPLMDEAYAEMGKTGSFQQRVDAAFERVLAAQEMGEDVTLVRPHVFYEFEDESLESLSPLEKALWRMGPENREKLQAYIKELNSYL